MPKASESAGKTRQAAVGFTENVEMALSSGTLGYKKAPKPFSSSVYESEYKKDATPGKPLKKNR